MSKARETSLENMLRSDEKLKAFNNTVPAGILVLEVEEGKVVFSNRFFNETLGVGGDQILGSSWDEFFVDAAERQNLMLDFIAQGSVQDFELRLKSRDDRIVSGLASMSSIQVEDEELLLFAFVDITPIKVAEVALQESNAELERYVIELDASKRDLEQQAAEVVEIAENEATLNEQLKYEVDVKNRFFSIISHDLKSPFTSLLGMTQVMSQMAKSLSKEQLVEYSCNVNEAGNRVFELLQNLLEWSRLQMEGARVEPEEVSLTELGGESIDILKPISLEKGIMLTNNIERTNVFVDPDMVRTVFRNLIANALKFTPSGGKVELSTVLLGDRVQITVSDTGVGMSEENASNIFSLDQKTSTLGTEGEIGTGLGLPLCKDMLERNRGSIWAESTPGGGSRFHFTLPVGPK
jgi:PAS domain S-box-containing protein